MPETKEPMNTEFNLRTMTPDDAAVVVRMVRELAEYIGVKEKAVMQPEDLVRYAFGDHPFVDGLIAEQDDKPVGLCLYYPIFSSWRGRPGVFVLDLYVDESCRGTGLGQRILSEVADISNRWGGRFIMLHVDQDNVSAQDFYAYLGFRHVTTEKAFILGGKAFLDLLTATDRP